MSETHTLLRDAGERFENGLDFAFQDALQRRLRYHLLRLTVVGLSRDEVPLIVDLARQAFEDADVTDQVSAIRDRPGASVLASAIAGIVGGAGRGHVRPTRGGRVGAVVGAYAGLMDAGGGDDADATAAAVLGAVGGGTAVSVGRFIQEQIAAVGVGEYLRTDEQV